MRIVRSILLALLGFASLAACSGKTIEGGGNDREPAIHRATATPCDHTRATNDPGAPPAGAGGYAGYVECRTHAECTAGENGRCVGNNHDGWRCTYDACFTDSDCPAPTAPASGPVVCACGNGSRSDENTCIPGNCRVDTDCDGQGHGWCSPSLGSCGHYFGFEGYYCHTPKDECLDDADCSGEAGYCAYNPTVGHWACSTINCVG